MTWVYHPLPLQYRVCQIHHTCAEEKRVKAGLVYQRIVIWKCLVHHLAPDENTASAGVRENAHIMQYSTSIRINTSMCNKVRGIVTNTKNLDVRVSVRCSEMGSSLTTFVAWGAVSFGPPPPRLQKRDLSSLVSVNTIAGHNMEMPYPTSCKR